MSEDERAQRWTDLAHAIFGDRPIQDAGDRLRLDAPGRAEDAAFVPVTVHAADPFASRIKAIYLVVDSNPSPLAAVFHFGPLADRRAVATRVRVDDYTYMHAVAEAEDGALYATRQFVKAAGGCSAPAGNDPALAQSRLGKMKLGFPEAAPPGAPLLAHLLISHPNSSGLQMDQLTRNYIPADYIEQVRITAGGSKVLTIDTDIAISEDPSLTFGLKPSEAGDIAVEVEDSSKRHFAGHWPLPAATQ